MELQSGALRDGIVMCQGHNGKWQATYRSHASEPAWVMMLFCRNCVNMCVCVGVWVGHTGRAARAVLYK